MKRTEKIDAAWLAAHPLPQPAGETDKNSRGRVLAVGGAAHVPGALRLTGEAALRAGAGKLQMATVGAVAASLGVLVPEAATIALPATGSGEIAPAAAPILREAMARCDALVLGPGMGDGGSATALAEALLARPRDELAILLDAAAIGCAKSLPDLLCAHQGRLVLTPHHGEMAALAGCAAGTIADDPVGAARCAADLCGGVVALKAGETIVAAADGALLSYPGGGVGLATGGSGDVLAGIIAGLLARGAPPLVATAWGVWLHGEAGKRLAATVGPLGFLARELLAEVPALMHRAAG